MSAGTEATVQYQKIFICWVEKSAEGCVSKFFTFNSENMQMRFI